MRYRRHKTHVSKAGCNQREKSLRNKRGASWFIKRQWYKLSRRVRRGVHGMF